MNKTQMEKETLDTEMSFRILIIEDNPTMMRMLEANFEKRGDEVILSRDGQNILDLIGSEAPDIILLDVMLPFKDGFTLLKDIRAAGVDTPVLMLTQKGEVDDKVRGLEWGADDYVTKPFSFRELYARIRSHLRRQKGAMSLVKVGSLRIDLGSRIAFFADKEISGFTKTEFDLLHHLAKASPQVVTHGDLLENVLGYRADAETKSLVMHIGNLRKKLKSNGLAEKVGVNSIPAVGYKLVVAAP